MRATARMMPIGAPSCPGSRLEARWVGIRRPEVSGPEEVAPSLAPDGGGVEVVGAVPDPGPCPLGAGRLAPVAATNGFGSGETGSDDAEPVPP
jgi:hypothetical protein